MKCCRCLRQSDDDTVAVLWDGKTYCRPCVDAELPGLFQFAQHHSQLEETGRYEPVRIVKRHSQIMLGFALFFGLLAGIALFESRGGFSVLAASPWCT